jgi:UDP-N-acetylglucosamine diphosphorylase/glucosamine-1-phosphate N-acetyltransferase
MNKNLVITIMAAGEGKRMNSQLPKVLHLFNDIPMLVRIINEANKLNPSKIIIITGKFDELIKRTLDIHLNTTFDKLTFVQQKNPNGTGDAINSTLYLYNENENVLILNGDMPLINKEILETFIEHREPMTILVARFSNPYGYGRILFDETDEFIGIVEEKDCTEEQKGISIINSGLYYIDANLLLKYVPMIENKNVQNEYYLTDIVKIIKTHEKISIKTHLISEDENKYISGVNTPEELAELE